MYCDATYIKCDVDIVSGVYNNGRLALALINAQNGTPIAKITTNIPELPLLEDQIIVKDWSENEGMLEFLINNGLVENVEKIIQAGHVFANVVRVTDKLKNLIKT